MASRSVSRAFQCHVTFCEVVFVIFAVDHLDREQPFIQRIELKRAVGHVLSKVTEKTKFTVCFSCIVKHHPGQSSSAASSVRSRSLCWFYLCSRLLRCMMAKTAPPTSWAHSRARQCEICRSPAPPTICGLNFPPTLRAQQRGSGSYTTVSPFSPARRILHVVISFRDKSKRTL